MSPLSAYTPFESLLFFQSLATLDARPASFVAISDVLRSNPFIRQNADFNAERLSPEALEELYSTLMRDGPEAGGALLSSGSDLNGHRAGSPSVNGSKRRKISSPRTEGLVDSISHASVVPKLVSHLYATYKDIVTKEIRKEEKRYDEIKHEIELLQREEREVPGPAVVQRPAQQASQVSNVSNAAKPEAAPEPMDVDTKEEKPVQHPGKEISKPPVERMPGMGDKQPQTEQRKEVNVPQVPAKIAATPSAPPPTTLGLQYPPAQPRGQLQNQMVHAQQQPPPIPQMATGQPPHPLPVNGNGNLPQQPNLGPRHTPTSKAAAKASPVQQVQSLPTATASPSRAVAVPSYQAPQVGHMPVGSPVQPAMSTTIPVSKEGPPMATPATAPRYPQAQPSFHQWNLNPPPQIPYPHISPYPTTPHANQAFAGRPFISPYPQQMSQTQTGRGYPGPYHPAALPTTPGPVHGAVQSPLPGGQHYETPRVAGQPLSFLESRSKRPSRPFVRTPGTLTPWKETPRLNIPESPASPVRPRPEDVSPISERAPSPIEEAPKVTSGKVEASRKRRSAERKGAKSSRERSVRTPDMDSKVAVNVKAEKSPASVRKRRDGSTPSSRGRGRSVASRDGGSPGPAPITRIKREMPSTSAGILEDEHRVAGRRRGLTVLTPASDQPARGRPKRKRGASEALEIEHLQSEPGRLDTSHAPQYVLCTRNFPRTGAAIMNDVTTHKHASIFTKPLTERDAPGYRDLIYRPQDLKSIKSAIHQGSKAVTAATEAASTPAGDGDSPAVSAGPAPTKNAVLMLQKTEDLIPPKGIVNSSQLEKELIRMFANAVMFNPIPQRGFGPAFTMIRDGGPPREYTHLIPEAEEGGIIKDTQEMFDDVEKAVTRWRAAERTAEELANKSIVSIRKGSVSDFNTDSADEVKG